jgi:hypothetical protein
MLGINEGFYYKSLFTYMTQFSAEAEFVDVSNAGYTALAQGRHAWIGVTARPNLVLFPGGTAQYPDNDDGQLFNNKWFNDWVAGRISLIGTHSFFLDAETGNTAKYYSAQL